LYQRGGLPGRGRLISSAFVPADPSRRIRRGEMGRECALDEQAFMSAALDMARRGLAAGEVPIGACLVQDGAVVATAHNAVGAGPDPTAHAEIVLIREACRRLRTTALGGAVLYVTVEPCPMCLAACHYAGVARVVYGAGIADLEAFTG